MPDSFKMFRLKNYILNLYKMKNLENLKGAKTLGKKEQQSVKGGKRQCNADGTCPTGWTCINGACERYLLE